MTGTLFPYYSYAVCFLFTVACDPKKCYATGRGIQPRGVRVGDLADIQVHTEGAGEGEVTGTLVGPHGGVYNYLSSPLAYCMHPTIYITNDLNAYHIFLILVVGKLVVIF